MQHSMVILSEFLLDMNRSIDGSEFILVALLELRTSSFSSSSYHFCGGPRAYVFCLRIRQFMSELVST